MGGSLEDDVCILVELDDSALAVGGTGDSVCAPEKLKHGEGDQGGLEDGVPVMEGLDGGAYQLQDPGQQKQQGALCPLLMLTGDDKDRKLLPKVLWIVLRGLEEGVVALEDSLIEL